MLVGVRMGSLRVQTAGWIRRGEEGDEDGGSGNDEEGFVSSIL